jgi:hypothetical protein
MAVQGYNVAFKLKVGNDYLTIAGRTQDDLTIAARTKERLMKVNAGTPDVIVTGQDVTFRASGLVDVTSSTAITRDALIGYALQAGDSAVIDFKYAVDGDSKFLSGSCVITNLSESSNSSDDATLTVDFRVVGAAEIEEEESA